MLQKPSYNASVTTPINGHLIITRLLMASGVCCFVISLFSNVFFTPDEDIRGYWVFITGWLGILFLQFAWYANPLNLIALLLVNQSPRTALLLSLLALVLASETFLFYEIPTGINQEKMYIQELGSGFFIWYLAQILFLVSILLSKINRHFQK